MRLSHLYSCMIVAGMLLLGNSVQAQQESQYSQYMYNTMSINPAYAGSRDALSALLLYRAQWVGLEGAPRTLNFGIHSPIGIKGVSLGFDFTTDEIGPSSHSKATAVFSYTIPMNDKGLKLAFGAQGGVSFLSIDPSELTIYNPNDYNLQIQNYTAPMVGVGFYLYTHKWYIGLSTPNFLKTEYYDAVKVSTATKQAHIYLTGGYVFDLTPNIEFKPATVFKGTIGAPISLDISANFRFYEKFTLGVAYRWDAAVSALAGLSISENIMVGYAYDYTTTEISRYNDGSHEIFLRFELGKSVDGKVNPRFF